MATAADNIRVAVRCRPLSSKELASNEPCVFSVEAGNVVLQAPGGQPSTFGFDMIYDADTQQERVFQELGAPVMAKAFEGFNGTIFAYGQTGSGKTHSMMGGSTAETSGVIPRLNAALFDRVAQETAEFPSRRFLVECSFFEIYNEIIYDLLDNGPRKKSGSGLQIKEHAVLGVYVKGLNEMVVTSAADLASLMARGMQSRHVASTLMNAESSRSHSVFTVKLHQKDEEDPSHNLFAKINLVDLAGSERAKGTGASGATLREGANINKSLSSLGSVINALVEKAKGKKKVFVPYRNSKLTRVLQESLGGNSLCSMLAALSPAACNYDETMSTLRYASRAKSVKVNAVKNEETSQIEKLNAEIAELRARLAAEAAAGGGAAATAAPNTHDEEQYRSQLRELDAIVKQTWEDKTNLTQEHESERQRMLAEREAAERGLEAEREKRWRLLEEKGDVELTLRHLTLPADVKAAWLDCLGREVDTLERVAEQRSVVRVYRNSLESDVRNWVGVAAADLGTSATLLRQAHAKLTTLQAEAARLLETEHATCTTPPELDALITATDAGGDQDLVRGLALLAKQVAVSRGRLVARLARERASTFDLGTIATQLCDGIRVLGASDAPEPLEAVAAQILAVLERTQRLSDEISSEVECAGDSSGSEDDDDDFEPEVPPPAVVVDVDDASLSCSAGQRSLSCCRLDDDVGAGAWCVQDAEARSGGPHFIEVALGRPTALTGVSLQGTSHSFGSRLPPTPRKARGLPNRFLLATGEVEASKALIAQAVGSWDALLHGASPDRLLQRPPVRFTHDLLVFICRETCFAPAVLEVAHPDYSAASKPEKVAAIRALVEAVADALGGLGELFGDDVDAGSIATNVVTGRKAADTNRLFQAVALAAAPPASGGAEQEEEPEPGPMFVTRFELRTSDDGSSWNTVATLAGNATADEAVHHDGLSLPPCRFVRLVPLEWTRHIAVRFQLRAAAAAAPERPAASTSTSTAAVPGGPRGVKLLTAGAEAVAQLLRVLTSAVNMTSEVVQARQQHEREAERSREQAMASEKQDLSERLAAALEHSQRLESKLARLEAEQRDEAVSRDADLFSQRERSVRLQAENERLEARCSGLEERLAAAEARAKEEAERTAEAQKSCEDLFAERDELYAAAEVLAEERDVSRAKEEELFAELAEAKGEMERLEEGYVNVTGRMNEYRDETEDLRELLQRYESAIEATSLPKSPRRPVPAPAAAAPTPAPAPAPVAPATPATPAALIPEEQVVVDSPTAHYADDFEDFE